MALITQDPRQKLVEVAAGFLQADLPIDAAREVVRFSGKHPASVDSIETAYYVLNNLLHWALNSGRYASAARLLWGPNLFNPNPRSTSQIWEAIQNNFAVLLMGAASMSKSYSTGVWLMLDWIRDPEFTTVRVIGPSEEHLQSNLFSHLVRLHRESKIPLPGFIGERFIGLDPRQRRSSITGVVVPVGKRKSGRIQGEKRIPRPQPHPIFGVMSRMRIFLDELEVIPGGIWKDIDNVFANVEGLDGFKIIGAFNPEDINGPAGTRCEPEGGWKEVNIDTSETWKSKRGWQVVRLDAEKCENVVEGKMIYPGLQTKEGLTEVIKNAGGFNTPGYYTMARAWFPPDGVNFSVIPNSMLNIVKGEFIWYGRTTPLAAADLALEGGDEVKVAVGQWGIAVGVRLPPTLTHPKGMEILFKDPSNQSRPKFALQLDQIFKLPKNDTVAMELELRSLFISLGISPENVLLDRTGNGAGVHDLMKANWSSLVKGVNYSEAATDKKILAEDTKTAFEEYERVVSELWFALRKYIEFEFFKISPAVETETLFSQLAGRLFQTGKKNKVESKREYKSRGNKSPDDADTVTLLVHCARLAFGVVVGATPDGYSTPSEDSDSYHHVDCTNRFTDDVG